MNRINRFIYLSLLVALIISCKKETEYANSPYNKIESFAITTSGNTISAALSGDSIIVYWPAYIVLPETVSPVVKVSENATLTPASGTGVALATGTKYTVKSQEGKTKDYFLKLVINQPGIQINENATYAVEKGGTFSINTNRDVKFLIEDVAKTKVFLVDNNDKEVELVLAFNERGGIRFADITVPQNISLSEGGYKLKFSSGQSVFTTSTAIVGILYPVVNYPKADALNTDVTVKRGGNIVFKGTGFIGMQDAYIWGYTATWQIHDIGSFKAVSSTGTTTTYQVPADFPLGTYQLDGYDEHGMFIQLRTSDFFRSWNHLNPTKNYVNVNGSAKITITD
ncbi:hypothetical protein DVR12_06275 [Chitinophaga silvatica]|uniref:DUF5018 domain-containing protein n=1 Tax=Chitinophaga silvatica TaxID=2282649 RepID=A0A3E1YES6_9BACT|nr:hypothetical protein [Chitinophaga silvatica]RFS24797.1 hypothetical protein DVR12_06275 [Chitinophaga silvatica]